MQLGFLTPLHHTTAFVWIPNCLYYPPTYQILPKHARPVTLGRCCPLMSRSCSPSHTPPFTNASSRARSAHHFYIVRGSEGQYKGEFGWCLKKKGWSIENNGAQLRLFIGLGRVFGRGGRLGALLGNGVPSVARTARIHPVPLDPASVGAQTAQDAPHCHVAGIRQTWPLPQKG